MRKEGLTTEDYIKHDAILDRYYPGPPPKVKQPKVDEPQLDLFAEDE